jgi:probable phosphoglycerate mutase
MDPVRMAQQPRRLKRVGAWEMMRDVSGNKYFHDHDTKTSQWDAPEIFGKVSNVAGYKQEVGRSAEELKEEADDEEWEAEEERKRRMPKPKRKPVEKPKLGHVNRVAELLFISHGRTAAGGKAVEGQGEASPLTALAKSQARYFGKRLRNACASSTEKMACYYTSDLERAYQTADLIFEAQIPKDQRRLKEVVKDPLLRERDYGNVEGMSLPQSREAEQATGETSAEFSARIVRRCGELALKHKGERILLVTHPGVIKALWEHSQRLGGDARRVFSVGAYTLNLKGMQNLAGVRLVIDNGFEELEAFEPQSTKEILPNYIHGHRTRMLIEFRGQPAQQERILARFPQETPPHQLPLLFSAVPCKRIIGSDFLLKGVPSESASVLGFQHLVGSSGALARAQAQRAWQ